MKTLTVTKARQNLGGWLKRAVAGEAIGVVFGDRVVALMPVEITAANYAELEYGLSPAEVDAAAARIVAETRDAETIRYTPGMLSRENPAHQTLSRRRKKAQRR